MILCTVTLDKYIATLLKSLEKLISQSLKTKAKLGAHEFIFY